MNKRSGRGTVEHVFILRNIIEQVVEWQATLYITFVDFEKAKVRNPSGSRLEEELNKET